MGLGSDANTDLSLAHAIHTHRGRDRATLSRDAQAAASRARASGACLGRVPRARASGARASGARASGVCLEEAGPRREGLISMKFVFLYDRSSVGWRMMNGHVSSVISSEFNLAHCILALSEPRQWMADGGWQSFVNHHPLCCPHCPIPSEESRGVPVTGGTPLN